MQLRSAVRAVWISFQKTLPTDRADGNISWLPIVLATGLVLGLSSVAVAQTEHTVSEGNLRPSWSDSAMADGWRSVCGDVRNVGNVPARSVSIRVQGLGTDGQVVSTRDRYVPAEVAAGSRAVFCVPMPAGATSYKVTVLHVDQYSF